MVSDDPWARAGLAGLLAEEPGIEVVGQVDSEADSALYQPEVLLWELTHYRAVFRKNPVIPIRRSAVPGFFAARNLEPQAPNPLKPVWLEACDTPSIEGGVLGWPGPQGEAEGKGGAFPDRGF